MNLKIFILGLTAVICSALAGDDIDAGIAFKNFKKCLNKCWGEYEDKVNNLPILNAADNDKYDQLYKDFESCVSSRCKND